MHRWADVCLELDTSVLQRKLVPGATQELSCEAVFRRVLLLPRLADPAAELVRVEMGIAAIDQRREGAVPEGEKGAIRTLGRTGAVPRSGGRAHALRLAAGEQPHDVDVVRGLVEHNTAAAFGIKLLGPPRSVQELREVERGDHA